jgi:hypothetical protein
VAGDQQQVRQADQLFVGKRTRAVLADQETQQVVPWLFPMPCDQGVHVSVSFGVQPQPFLRGHGRVEEPVAARTELGPVGERHPEQLADHQ